MFHSNSARSSVHAHTHAHRHSQSRQNPVSPQASNSYQPQQIQYQASRRSQASGVPDQSQLYQWFRKVDTDGSGEISVQELQAALINGELISAVGSHANSEGNMLLQAIGPVSSIAVHFP